MKYVTGAYLNSVHKEAAPLAGAFMKGLMDIASGATKAMVQGVPASTILTTGASLLPVVAAMQLMDLSQTGEVLGTYIKNKLVPGLEESNMAREMELAAKMEMGSKQLPMLNAETLSYESGKLIRSRAVEEALTKKDEIMENIERDPLLAGISKTNLEKLVDDAIRIAPMVVTDTPSVVLSLIRSAALTGADSIAVETANQLATLERSYTGRM